MTEHSSSNPLDTLPPRLPPPAIDPDLLEVESLKVIARLRRYGHVAYLVGGCVRDLLCNARPKDFDVATSAEPEEVRSIFRNSRLVGRRFRLAHVFFPGGQFIEVATFRANPLPPEPPSELEEEDEEEQPEEDEPVDLLVTDDNLFGTAEEDALRRDFTVNGLFYDPTEGVIIDYVGGRADLEAKLIRTIGNPEIRLQEDPVRALRAARIAAKLGFRIDDATFRAMENHADAIPRCAPARVLEETLKLLRSGASREAFSLLRQARVLRYLLPAVERVLTTGGAETEKLLFARLDALDSLLADGEAVSDAVMLATLLSFLPIEEEEESTLPSASEVLAQMSAQARLPRRIADRTRAVLAAQSFFAETSKKRKRRGAGFVRTPHFTDSLHLFEISVRATGENQAQLETWKRRARGEPDPPRPPPPPTDGPPKKKKPRRNARKKKAPSSDAPAPQEPDV